MADREAEVPHHVEQMLDDLLAAGGELVRVQEEDIDIGVGRQIAPAVAADRHQRKTVGRGRVRQWVEDLGRPIQQHAQQLVDQSGLGCNDLGARRPGFEASPKRLAALIAGASHNFEHARPVVPTEPTDRPCESPSVEEVRRRIRRVHHRKLGKQATLGGLSR